jgi:hypothetical protein
MKNILAIVGALAVLMAGVCAAKIRVAVPPDELSWQAVLSVAGIAGWFIGLAFLLGVGGVLMAICGFDYFHRKKTGNGGITICSR